MRTRWVVGLTSMQVSPSSERICRLSVLTPCSQRGRLRTPTRANPSERSWLRASEGGCTPPSHHQPSMQRSAKITRHSSPGLIGAVIVMPPPPKNITGTSGRMGSGTRSAPPSGLASRPMIAGCTLTVGCPSGPPMLTLSMMPGIADQRLSDALRIICRVNASGSPRISSVDCINNPCCRPSL